jgi:hypothetical protein
VFSPIKTSDCAGIMVCNPELGVVESTAKVGSLIGALLSSTSSKRLPRVKHKDMPESAAQATAHPRSVVRDEYF